MERMTIRNSDGSVSQPTDLKWAEALYRLASYEDTGLTPEEVSALVKDWSDLRTIIGECGGIGRLRNLAEADKDGRLVVLEDGVCEHFSEPGITSYCVEGPCSAYLPEYIMYGDYIKLIGTETPEEIRRGTELLAEQAGECVKQAILGGRIIRRPLTIGWKVGIYAGRFTDD